MMTKSLLDFKLITVTVRQYPGVGEREPASPAKKKKKKSEHLVKLWTNVYSVSQRGLGQNRMHEYITYILFFSFSP